MVLELLGKCTLRVKSEDRTDLLRKTGKGTGILVLLCLKRGAVCETLHLQERLWPDVEDTKKRGANFRQQKSRLEDALGASKDALITKRGSLRLDMHSVTSDLTTFLDCLDRSDWQGAVNAYGGPLLPEHTDLWAEEERERLRSRFIDAAAHLVAQQKRTSPEEALQVLERWRAEAPESEEPLRLRWEVLVMLNRPAQALAEAEEYSARGSSLDMAPETRLLLERLRKTRQVKELPPLPTTWTRFIGRDMEIRDLLGRVRGERLFTLYGEGGMGKTRLALELARRLYATLEGQIAFIDLSKLPAGAPASAIWALLEQALSEPRGSIPELRALLLLDNAEHVLPAVGEVVQALLQKGQELQLLVTSRKPLGYWQERKLHLKGLLLPDARTLFIQTSVEIENLNDPQERAALDRLCERLDRWPFAIELTASRREGFGSLSALERNLEQALLEAGAAPGDPTISERERTLNTTLDWSARLLPESVHVLWQACSSFVGGITPEALAGVTAQPRSLVEAALEHLAAVSLMRKEGSRYRLLEPVRTYLKPKETTQQAFATYFLNLAESQPGDEVLEAERANMAAAGEWLVDVTPDGAMRLGAALWRFWWLHGSQIQGFAFLKRALAAAKEHPLRTEVLLGAGALAYGVSEPEAEEFSREAQERAHAAGDTLLEARAWLNWGLAAFITGQNELGRERARQAEALFARVEHEVHRERGMRLARANQLLAVVRMGDREQAIALYQTSLEEFDASGDVDGWLTEAVNCLYALAGGDKKYRVPLNIELLRRAYKHSHFRSLVRGLQASLAMLPPYEGAVLYGALDRLRLEWGIPLGAEVVGRDQVQRWEYETALGTVAWQSARDQGASLSLEVLLERVIQALKNS